MIVADEIDKESSEHEYIHIHAQTHSKAPSVNEDLTEDGIMTGESTDRHKKGSKRRINSQCLLAERSDRSGYQPRIPMPISRTKSSVMIHGV